jgi:hypothetical protein
MCTVSWLHQNGGYQLLSNRDEKRTRAQAAGPEIKYRDGVRFIAPTDRHGGGTWIGTNELGVSLCLLNGPPAGGSYQSRGLLLIELLSAPSFEEARKRLRSAGLLWFAPFTLAILAPGGNTAVMKWDGRRITDIEPRLPLVSSSLDPQGVHARRRAEFDRRLKAAGEPSPSLLFGFHLSHGNAPDAYSPCMHRPDAETVSLSWVKVTKSHIEFFYLPGAPCRSGSGETVTLQMGEPRDSTIAADCSRDAGQ